MLLRRANVFEVKFIDNNQALKLGDICARAYNDLNYLRHNCFLEKEEDDWLKKTYEEIYWRYNKIAPTDILTQILNDNNDAWSSFFGLLRALKSGKLKDTDEIGFPGFWKNKDGIRHKIIIAKGGKKPVYRIDWDEKTLKLPKGVQGRVYGVPKWHGFEGELKIIYNKEFDTWHGFQSVTIDQLNVPVGENYASVDMGINYPLSVVFPNGGSPCCYKSKGMMTRWYQHSYTIDKIKSELEIKNDRKTSHRLNRVFAQRKNDFKDDLRKLIHRFIFDCLSYDIGTIVIGDLKRVTQGDKGSRRLNKKIKNYWGVGQIVDMLKCIASNYGIKVVEVSEKGTSSRCSKCGSKKIIYLGKKGKKSRGIRCEECGIEMHRDVVGAYNIGYVYTGKWPDRDNQKGVVAHPRIVYVS
jgi:putative transposase